MVFSYPIRLLSILLCILISISSIASSRDSFSSKNGNDFPLKEEDLDICKTLIKDIETKLERNDTSVEFPNSGSTAEKDLFYAI